MADLHSTSSASLRALRQDIEVRRLGHVMHDVMTDLFPLCRSITGNGVRGTLGRLQDIVPLNVCEVPSGTPVFDWMVPLEWNITDAYVKNAAGERVIDFKRSNLHVVSYSTPIRARMTLAELRPHLHTLPEHPAWIPYRTSYYRQTWGFCLAHRDLESLSEGMYDVAIESTLAPGHLTYGEFVLPGETPDEVLISAHVCHPSMCNDNLSGIVLAATLAQLLTGVRRRYTYRFVFVPGTIGSITWLALNETSLPRVRHGLVVAYVGDVGPMTYKRTQQGDAEIDRAVEHVLRHSGQPHSVVDFSPYGNDERQYNSPGINLAIGSLTRSTHARYAEYHTSADNLELVRPEALEDSLARYLAVIAVLEGNRRYLNLSPKCEPQLGRRGLYRMMGGMADAGRFELAALWVLNQSNGRHSLLDIATRADMDFDAVCQAADALVGAGLLEVVV